MVSSSLRRHHIIVAVITLVWPEASEVVEDEAAAAELLASLYWAGVESVISDADEEIEGKFVELARDLVDVSALI